MLPNHEGVASVEVDLAGVRLQELPVRHSLTELAGDYVFFNHGLLFTRGGLDVTQDPIARRWVDENLPEAEVPRFITLPEPVFQGIGGEWDQTLCLVRSQFWLSVSSACRFASGVDWNRRISWSAVELHVAIHDPFASDGELVFVTVFSVNSNRTKFGLRPGDGVFHVVTGEPEPVNIALANALFQGAADPFRAIEPTEHSIGTR